MEQKQSVKDRLGWAHRSNTNNKRSKQQTRNDRVIRGGRRTGRGNGRTMRGNGRGAQQKQLPRVAGGNGRTEPKKLSNTHFRTQKRGTTRAKNNASRPPQRNKQGDVRKRTHPRSDNQNAYSQNRNDHRTDQQNTAQGNEQLTQFGSMFVTIPLYLFCRRFTAAVDCFTGMTKIGREVAQMAIANGYAKKSQMLTVGQSEKRVEFMTIHMGTKVMRLKPIDCVIDASAPPRGIIIGLQAMAILGYRLLIDEVPASHHEAQRLNIPRQQAQNPENIPEEPFQEEEFVMAITESERKEIENLG